MQNRSYRNVRMLVDWSVPLLSVVIISVWLVQFFISVPWNVWGSRRGKVRLSWPFLDYPMYRDLHRPGDAWQRLGLVAVLEDGREAEVAPKDLGVIIWHFEFYARALRDGNFPVVEHMCRVYEQRSGVRVKSVRLEDRSMIWTEEGMVAQPVRIVTEYRLPEGAEDGGER